MTLHDPARPAAAAGRSRTTRIIAPDELPRHAQALLGGGYRIALVAGHDDGDALRAVYLFTATGERDAESRVELHVPLDPGHPHVPSLAALSFPAGRFEREMRDLFGIVPDNHPLPQRLVRHFHWPRGWYPMLAEAGDPPAFGDLDEPYPFRTVEGPGVYEIPVGPVHAGMIEPGHFRFSVVGETILNLKARLWFVHRGIEKLFQGRRVVEALELTERVSGDTAVGHTLAFCLAIEDALGLDVPRAAGQRRAVACELERLYNHITDLGALCNDVAHSILNSQAQRIREQLLRLNEQVTGHRLLRGAIRPGGAVLRVLPDPSLLRTIAEDIAEVVALALEHSVVRERFAGTAILTRQQATDIGTLGYVARASGLRIDARYDHPFLSTPIPRPEHSHTGGDVLARFCVRAEEIAHSVEVIAGLVAELDGDLGSAPPTPAVPSGGPGSSGVGIVEGWRGTITHRIELDAGGRLSRVKIVDPSFFNWPALPVALADTIVPDFPLVNKSFNLSYAGNDL
ncbi:NADH-quinone oxidoreductase subunit C [Pseudonocardia asaccharolytica]|uniref:Formate hydrogenase HycE n=2 Tax=Pseudonocardia asaccharolytica TaxID=54010 RepID=A0A511CX10_9PSEU|nr:NADH-quinone oxidoreductase subunit C [Pseudonocardia asaccharolytica]GEL17100.1 formate hydrogenase HycE [Pseudonocardia asaccharolytica DSM 44247 = NBRC 16224]